MTVVALIGADGAGKTTVAQRIADRSDGRIRYVYMGMNAQANPYALPTSRLVLTLKRRRHSRTEFEGDGSTSSIQRDYGHSVVTSGRVAAGLRLINRFLEEWFRWVIVWSISWRGHIVICDRHFVLDHSLGLLMGKPNRGPLTERIHRWMLFRFYPKPDLVVFLDAPAETLYARKQDAPLDYLRSRQRAYKEATQTLRGFVSVDGTQDLESVTMQVEKQIALFRNASPKASDA